MNWPSTASTVSAWGAGTDLCQHLNTSSETSERDHPTCCRAFSPAGRGCPSRSTRCACFCGTQSDIQIHRILLRAGVFAHRDMSRIPFTSHSELGCFSHGMLSSLLLTILSWSFRYACCFGCFTLGTACVCVLHGCTRLQMTPDCKCKHCLQNDVSCANLF